MKAPKGKKETIAIACKAITMNRTQIAECRRQKAISRRGEKGESPSKKLKMMKEGTV